MIDDPVAAKLEAEKRWPDLVKHLASQVDTTPAAQRAGLYLEIALIHQDRFSNMAEAIKAYERVLEHEPSNRRALDALRAAFEKRRDWEKLLELEKGELDRLEPEKRADKAVEIARLAAARVGKPDVTIYWWQRVLEYEPDHRQALAELAKSFERAERPTELASVLRQQVEIAQGNDDRLATLRKLAAVCEELLHDLHAARDAWQQVLDTAPGDADAKRALARIDAGEAPPERIESEPAPSAPTSSAFAPASSAAQVPAPVSREPVAISSSPSAPNGMTTVLIGIVLLAIAGVVIYVVAT